MRRFAPVAALLMILLSCATAGPDCSNYDHYARAETAFRLSKNITLEITPETELLACILSRTSWMKVRGPKGRGNQYFRELQALAAPFQRHPAVAHAESLTKGNFTYDAPLDFILRTRLPDMELVHEYNEYLKRRARGAQNIDRFRALLRDFAADSEFMRFYNRHVPVYRAWLRAAQNRIAAEKITAWIEGFFGTDGSEFHIVLAPAMPFPGGYGCRIDTASGPLVYQVVRERGSSEGPPVFLEDEHDLDNLTVHEFGHSYVNHLTARHEAMITARLRGLYAPVEQAMKDQAYGNLLTFFNETIIRALTIRCMDELFYHSAEYRRRSVEREAKVGFFLVQFTLDRLDEYAKNRCRYRTFGEYLPVLLAAYAKDSERLIEMSKSKLQ